MERSQFLQMMRFVAAGLVLFTHITFYYHERVDRSLAVWGQGAVGVPIFFVISGIVMVFASQSLPPGPAGAQHFLVRRLIRIVPLWWLALGIKVAVALAAPGVVNHNHFQLDHAVKSFFFIPYFTGDSAVVPLHGVGWTLLHEMFFYLLFSLALLLGIRPVLWVSASIVGLWLTGLFWHVDAAWWVVATHEANLQFVFGMALATVLLAPRLAGRLCQWLGGALLLGAAVLCIPSIAATVHFMYPVLLTFAASTLFFVHFDLPRPLAWAVRLGDSSYSLYLFHPFVAPAAILVLARLLPELTAWAHILIVLVFTIIVSHGLHLAAEVPIVRAARRRLPGGSSRTRQERPASA